VLLEHNILILKEIGNLKTGFIAYFSLGVKMEIEDLVLSTFVISALGCFFIYAMTNPLPYSTQLVKTLAIGGLWAYLFNNPNIL
jgi:hypothetical protein